MKISDSAYIAHLLSRDRPTDFLNHGVLLWNLPAERFEEDLKLQNKIRYSASLYH